MITILLTTVLFIKIFILFMSILYCIREGFKLFKSVKMHENFVADKGELLILGMAIAYILTIIFI